MKVMILGCGNTANLHPTCILIKHKGTYTLLDCGFSTLDQFARYNLDSYHVSAILLTHCHVDHFGGAVALASRQADRKGSRRLQIYGPMGIHERWDAACWAYGATRAKAHTDVTQVTSHRLEHLLHEKLMVQPFHVWHSDDQVCLGYNVVSPEDVNVVFTGDMNCQRLRLDIKHTHLLIADSAGLETNGRHLTPEGAVQLGRDINARRTVLTHLPGSSKHNRRLKDVISKHSSAEFPVEIAQEGKVYVLPETAS